MAILATLGKWKSKRNLVNIFKYDNPEGRNKLTLRTDYLSAGLYIVKVEAMDKYKLFKMVKE